MPNAEEYPEEEIWYGRKKILDFEHVVPELPFKPKKHICGDWSSNE
jgi:hypothetical protein